jgi:predicted small metal-binding protein
MMNFHCKDCGMDCSFHMTGTNERELSQQAIQHMHSVHEMDVIPAEVMLKMFLAIRNNKTPHRIRPGLATEPLAA